jgi:hypothetical protein
VSSDIEAPYALPHQFLRVCVEFGRRRGHPFGGFGIEAKAPKQTAKPHPIAFMLFSFT